ncbi:hypothetical protein AAII07_57025 [Microvirga sp. 0TCS3.31]
MTGIWFPIGKAPRDGTPVILWIDDDEVPPVLPETVGFWVTNPITGVGYWRIFGRRDSRHSYADRQVRGWKPLLRGWNA